MKPERMLINNNWNWLTQVFLTGLGGAILLIPIELWTLSPLTTSIAWVSIILLLGLGLVISIALTVAEGFVMILQQRWVIPSIIVAAIRSVASLIVFTPAASHLFEGAFASSLPGAAYTPYILPPLGFITVTIIIWSISCWISRLPKQSVITSRKNRILSCILLCLTLLTDFASRTFFRSEYPDVHVMLTVVAVVLAGCGLRFGLKTPSIQRYSGKLYFLVVAGISTAGISAVLIASFSSGLSSPESRSAIVTRGMHTRMLVRVARILMDCDDDGFSAILGGPDCNDQDPAINPTAKEIVANTTDENCDGLLGQTDTALEFTKIEKIRQIQIEDWLSASTIHSLRERLQDHPVLLITVDALRGDMLTNSEQTRNEFPNLFALMNQSCVFTRAFAPAAGTDLSLSSLLTSQIDPFSHVKTTLAEAFAARNRVAYAVIPSEVLRYAGQTLLTRGFSEFHRLINDLHQRDVGSYTTGARTTKLGLDYLDAHSQGLERDKPIFLWLHYFDVHEHDEVDDQDRHLHEYLADRPLLPGKEPKYRAMVGLVDVEIGVLIRELQSRKLWDQTVIAFVSDHGESLGEDPRLPNHHGHVLYNPLVHVPMLIRIPGVEPCWNDTPVSILDIMPTLLALEDEPLPADMDGSVLLPKIISDAPAELRTSTRPIIFNETDQYGVLIWPFKLLIRANDNITELFNLAVDFGETQNLAESDPAKVAELLQIYQSAPVINLDRTSKGRRLREQAARNAYEAKQQE